MEDFWAVVAAVGVALFAVMGVIVALEDPLRLVGAVAPVAVTTVLVLGLTRRSRRALQKAVDEYERSVDSL